MKQNMFDITRSHDGKQFYLRHMVYLPNRGSTPFGYNTGVMTLYSESAALDSKALLEGSPNYQQQLDNRLMTYVAGDRIILAADINQAARVAREDEFIPTNKPVRPIERGEYIAGYGFIT